MFRPLIYTIFFLVSAYAQAGERFPLPYSAIDPSPLLLSDWRFQAEPPGSEVDWSTEEFAEARAAWTEITIPAIWDKRPGEVTLPVPEQAAWYRTVVPLPKLTSDQELALCFLGVKYIADVFVNGEYVGVHRGGYTPFLITVPDLLPETAEIEIVVRVDNRLDDHSIPKKNTGWEIYGGIDREVYLLVRPSIRPENVAVRTFRDSQGDWQLNIHAASRGEPKTPLSLKVFDNEKIIASSEQVDWSNGIDLSLSLENPTLWSPEHPHLYQLEMTWGRHRLQFPIGVREIKWDGGKLTINGNPVWLQGFGQHEFYPESGSILTREQRKADLEMMKNLYAVNTVRTGHYPHHPELFSLADELGLLIFTEVPAWQNHPNSLSTPRVWDNWILPQLSEMIQSYRNHPSIFGWGVLNETAGAHPYIVKARKTILHMDPTRGVAAVIASTEDFGINTLTDFAARNLHYGWYHSRSVYKLREGVDRNLENSKGLPIWVAELGGQARPGKLGGGYDDQIRGTETYQDKMTRFGLQYIMSRSDELAGISLWTWSDYEKKAKPHYHGILSAERKPKLAAYTAMNLMSPPLVALGIEHRASIAVGETFKADLFVFSQKPRPDEKVTFLWQIRSATAVKKEGKQSVTLGESRSTNVGEIEWVVAETQTSPLHFLYVEVQDTEGNFLHSQAIPFEASDTTRPGVLRIPPHNDGKEHLAILNGMTFKIYPHAGCMIPLDQGDYTIMLDNKVYPFKIYHGEPTELPWEN